MDADADFDLEKSGDSLGSNAQRILNIINNLSIQQRADFINFSYIAYQFMVDALRIGISPSIIHKMHKNNIREWMVWFCPEVSDMSTEDIYNAFDQISKSRKK